jgi:hypothetical protein
VKYYGMSSLNELLNHYNDLQDKTQKKITDMKSTNPQATGIKPLEDQLAVYKDLTKGSTTRLAWLRKATTESN